MSRDDTFFQLSTAGQIGTAAISAVLAALMLWLCWRIVRKQRLALRLILALGLIVLFEWLSPQIYYLWYMAVFDGLPLNWVAGYWPHPVSAAKVLTLQAGDSLSAHSRALLGWAMIGIALFVRGQRRKGPPGRAGPWVD